jgi:hypothetical protein
MTKQIQENKAELAVRLFDALRALYASEGGSPESSVVMSFVDGFMWAVMKMEAEKAAPAKPQQRRARRKKVDIAMATDAFLARGLTLEEARSAAGERSND